MLVLAVAAAGCGGADKAAPWPPLAPLGAQTGGSWRAVWDMGGPLDPSSRNPCARGSLPCMSRVVDEMSARLGRMARTCDHLAPFALMYRQVTDEVAASARAGRYRSPEYAIHLDAVFATLYFHAADAWRDGRKDEVPRAWRLAFAAADRRELPAIGNMLLGMNAHISRDLPYALAATGLRTADGEDAQPDVVAVNKDIARAQAPMLRDVARRFDPTVGKLSDLGTIVDPREIGSITCSRPRRPPSGGRSTPASTPTPRPARSCCGKRRGRRRPRPCSPRATGTASSTRRRLASSGAAPSSSAVRRAGSRASRRRPPG